MQEYKGNKFKIINDPVYGFISFRQPIIFDIISHPYFQRLRRIKQLSLTYLVYPGAIHTRFQHALGAMHLMNNALDILQKKGHTITPQETEAALIAILLHDIGHGPFSHTLEHSFVQNISHEEISLMFMQKLNEIFEGKIEMAIEIFTDKYPKKFLHQLVSSQLDMDRLDYLMRDSFFSGVSEGVVSSGRIINMLNIFQDELVVEAKGIYSIEKFLIARRLMYWQVYLHKTVIAAEEMLMKILLRAQQLARKGIELFATPALMFFLKNKIDDILNLHEKESRDKFLEIFSQLDDNDIVASIKVWTQHSDEVLAMLCKGLINRDLLRIEIYPQSELIDLERVEKIRAAVKKKYKLSSADVSFLVFYGNIFNNAYSVSSDNINILTRHGKIIDIAQASDVSNVTALSKTVTKSFLCFPRNLETIE